jgi:hypothetical protein
MTDWGTGRPIDFNPLGPPGPIGPERCETIEVVGPHLRVTGDISLLRFTRLSDLINHSRGFVKLTGAELLRRNGVPTGLVVQELMVNQDEITFVGQKDKDVSTAETGLVGGMDRPLMERVPRELVIFTEGHTLTGTIHLFSETDIATFVDSPDPRFVAMTAVTTRSLADRRVISHFGLVLVNRTQIVAASLREMAGGTDETGMDVA